MFHQESMSTTAELVKGELVSLAERIEHRIGSRVDEQIDAALLTARDEVQRVYLAAVARLVGRRLDVKITAALEVAEHDIAKHMRAIMRSEALAAAAKSITDASATA